MRFRSGGIGHKATRDWDEFLRRDFGKCVEVDENDDETDSEEGPMDPELQVEGDEVEEWKGVMEEEEDGNESDEDSDSDSDSGSSDENDADRVVADEGEELVDDIYAREGYGAL